MVVALAVLQIQVELAMGWEMGRLNGWHLSTDLGKHCRWPRVRGLGWVKRREKYWPIGWHWVIYWQSRRPMAKPKLTKKHWGKPNWQLMVRQNPMGLVKYWERLRHFVRLKPRVRGRLRVKEKRWRWSWVKPRRWRWLMGRRRQKVKLKHWVKPRLRG